MYTDNLSVAKRTIVGVQFLFVAFGATVLVPLLMYARHEHYLTGASP